MTAVRLNAISARHWHDLARSVAIEGLWERMIDTVERAPEVCVSLEKRLPKDFPESVYAAIAKRIDRHARDFLEGLAQLH